MQIEYVYTYKDVVFFDLYLKINSNFNYLAVDKYNNLLGFEKKPKLYENHWLSCWETGEIIGKLIDYTGDWRESLNEYD